MADLILNVIVFVFLSINSYKFYFGDKKKTETLWYGIEMLWWLILLFGR